MIGKIIENYKIVEEIAQGGMGKVFKAIHESLERIVAIKMIHPKLLSNDRIVKNFYNEAKIQASLNHPNIVAVYDFFQKDDKHYVVMEYVDGESISKILHHQNEFDVSIAISIFKQILNGINYAHSKNVIHKDIKTGNFLLTTKTVKITDFGIAQILDETSGKTKSDLVIGTPKYMSPEQILGKSIDKRTDIYSLGIILYEFLTGRVPFDTDGTKPAFEVRKSQLKLSPKTPSEINQKIPKSLDQIILKALSYNADDRFQTIEEFMEAINSYKNPVDNEKTTNKKKEAKTKKAQKKDFNLSKGSLSKTNFAYIISSLYFQKSTGLLEIDSDKKLTIHFYNGYITFIDYSEPSLHLGEILIKENKISSNDLFLALDYSNKTGSKFGESLIKLEKITHHELNNILKSQIVEKLQIGFTLTNGKFEFKPTKDINTEAIYEINPLQTVYDVIKDGKINITKKLNYNNELNSKIIPRDNILDEINKLILTSPKEIKMITILKEGMKISEFIKKSSINDDKAYDFLAFLELSSLVEIPRNKKNNSRIDPKTQQTEIITNI